MASNFGKTAKVVNNGKQISHFYMNRSTGEITESHSDAVQWYRDGAEVEVWHNNRLAVVWEF